MLVPHAVRIIALSSGLALLAGAVPASAWAAPESEPSAAPSEADPEGIFRRGQAKYETADYNGAIELWTEAYALVDSTPENASIKALLIYNLAQAHSKAYEIDGDPIHLKQAQQLLRSSRLASKLRSSCWACLRWIGSPSISYALLCACARL